MLFLFDVKCNVIVHINESSYLRMKLIDGLCGHAPRIQLFGITDCYKMLLIKISFISTMSTQVKFSLLWLEKSQDCPF